MRLTHTLGTGFSAAFAGVLVAMAAGCGSGPAGPAATATPSADEIRQSEQAANSAAAAEATAMPADDASSK